jgi:hypothetical protein
LRSTTFKERKRAACVGLGGVPLVQRALQKAAMIQGSSRFDVDAIALI